MQKKLFIAIFLLTALVQVKAQVVFQPISSPVYEFIDELATEQVITINSVSKPYSRMLIAEKLKEASLEKENLNNRQQKELEFYLRDFNKELKEGKDFDKRFDLFYYDDSLFSLTANPILGGKYLVNDKDKVFHRWNGAEVWGYAGKHLGFSASLRDNGVSEMLALPQYLTPMQGANYKINQGVTGGRSDFSEMKGGINYSWNWGSLGLRKDNFTWGNNYNGSVIFSGRAPSFTYLQFKMNPVKWFDFNYIHGFLVSEVIDSARTYNTTNGQQRLVYHDKYVAANMFTFKPWSTLDLSLGNSVIYSDAGVQPAYLFPFGFFKSIDHTYNATGSSFVGQNSQMFFDISSRQIKKLHLYGTLFLDELSIKNMFDEDQHTNLYSLKAGARLTNFGIPNTSFILEYTRTNPWTFEHQVPTTTFESNNYNLGHYLVDNAEEVHFNIRIKPIRALQIDIGYTQAIKGPEMQWKLIRGNTNVPGSTFVEEVTWYKKLANIRLNYQVLNDAHIFASYRWSDIQGNETYAPEFFKGQTRTISGGINYGF